MLWIAAVLGVVEGLTEFLPVSSTGHLILVGHFLNFSDQKAATFEIFIQLGAILAVFWFFRERFVRLMPFQESRGFSGMRGLLILCAVTIPALVLGVLLHKTIKQHLFTPQTVAMGLIAGGIWILLIEKIRPQAKTSGLDDLTWKHALAIGFIQCLAMWPGVSRAGATILGAMMLGVDRKTATEFSFFAAVPVITAASLYDLLKNLDLLQKEDLGFFIVGFLVSMISAWLAVKYFVKYVSKHNLNIFGWYRIALAVLVLFILR